MKPSNTELDTTRQSQTNDIKINSTQSNTHIQSTNSDINDIRFGSLQINDNPSSLEDENTTTTITHITKKYNHTIQLNPWQDIPSQSTTTHSETKRIHKNSDDNTDHHYSSTLLSNHETANIHNNTTKQWNRNSDTVVWNKQNLMSRLSAPFKHHTVNPTSQSTITDVW